MAEPGEAPVSRVTIAVIHWGNINDTMACVGSVFKLHYKTFDVLVVNNGMPPDSLRELGLEFPRVTVKHLEKNTGFAGASNTAIAYARNSGSSFVWLLNNDILVDDFSCLNTMVDEAVKSGKAVLSPLQVVFSRRKPRIYSGALFFPALALTFHGGTVPGWFFGRISWSLPFLSGAALLLNLKRIPDPFFDEEFFAYYEDVDVCLRLGPWQIGVCEEASIIHKVSGSTGGSLWKHYMKARNLVYLARKHGMFTRRFVFCYWFLFVPMEARKYLLHPFEYFRQTRRAWWKGREMRVTGAVSPEPQ